MRRLSLLVVATWLGLATEAIADSKVAPPVTSLKNAATGAPLGGAVSLVGVMEASNPDTEPVSILSPGIQYELSYSQNGPDDGLSLDLDLDLGGLLQDPLWFLTPKKDEVGAFLGASGDLLSSFGSMPLANLVWDGAGTDSKSVWTATRSRSNPNNQALATATRQFGLSKSKKGARYYNTQLKLKNSWLQPWGTYSAGLSYGYRLEDGPVLPTSLAIALTVPPRVALSVPPSHFTLTADPLAASPATSNVRAVLKSNARPGEATTLAIRARPLSDGINTIPFGAYTFRLGSAAPRALSETDQTVASFSGPSAETPFDLSFQVDSDWAYAPATYTSQLTYTAAFASGAAPPAVLTPTTVAVTVPPRLTLTVNTGPIQLVSDPEAPGTDQADGAAVVTLKSNYGQTTLSVAATAPTSERETLPLSSFLFRASPSRPPVGGEAVRAQVQLSRGNGVWDAFSQQALSLATLDGRTDGGILTFDYRFLPSWAYTSDTYVSTVTYTAAGY